jgi:ubiquinone/menaquinone biosynthesis C-methylase UbiE
MGWSLTPRRRHDPELMDAPGQPADEVADAYQVLRRVNRQLGNLRTLRAEIRQGLAENRPGSAVALLDVGAGAGDLTVAMRRELEASGQSARAVALDLDPIALRLAAQQGLEVVRANALRLPFPDRAFDLVTAVKFAHHFHGPPLSRLLAEMARVARRRVLVLDIRRHWAAYGGFVLWSRLFTRNRLVRHDGPLSVLRGFTHEELLRLAEPFEDFVWEVRSRLGFQLVLIGRRREG